MDDKNINIEEQEVLNQTEEVNVEESSEEVVAKKPNKRIAIALVAGVAAAVAFVALDPLSVFSGDTIEVETAEELVELEVAEEVCTDEDCTDENCEEVEEVEVETEEVEVTEEVAVETEVATTEKEVAKETTTATTNTTTSTAKPSTSNSTSSNTHTCTWKTTTEQVLVKAATTETVTYYRDQYRNCAIANGSTRNLTLEWEAYCASNGSITFGVWNNGFGGGYTMKSVVVGQESYTETITVPAEYKTVSTTTCTVCGAVK